jgi:hypothetical protein
VSVVCWQFISAGLYMGARERGENATDKRDAVRWTQRGGYIELNFMASDNGSILKDAHLSYFVYNQITLSNLHYCVLAVGVMLTVACSIRVLGSRV